MNPDEAEESADWKKHVTTRFKSKRASTLLLRPNLALCKLSKGIPALYGH